MGLIARGKDSTSPALLAGIWVFFSTMDILELYEIENLMTIAPLLINYYFIGIAENVWEQVK